MDHIFVNNYSKQNHQLLDHLIDIFKQKGEYDYVGSKFIVESYLPCKSKEYLPHIKAAFQNVECTEYYANTILNALLYKNDHLILLLLECAADLKWSPNTEFMIDKETITFAHIFALNGKDQILQHLISQSPDCLLSINSAGHTILDYAEFGGHKECIRLIQSNLNISPVETLLEEKNTADAALVKDKLVTTYQPNKVEAKALSVEQSIHKYYQLQKKLLATIQKVDVPISELTWDVNGITYKSNSENIISSLGISNKHSCFFTISNELANRISVSCTEEVLDKFTRAMQHGFTGKSGKAGVRNIKNQLYELKIIGHCAELRMYTTKQYINKEGGILIIFDDYADHQEISRKVNESNGIESIIAYHNEEHGLEAGLHTHAGEISYNDFDFSSTIANTNISVEDASCIGENAYE